MSTHLGLWLSQSPVGGSTALTPYGPHRTKTVKEEDGDPKPEMSAEIQYWSFTHFITQNGLLIKNKKQCYNVVKTQSANMTNGEFVAIGNNKSCR